MQFDVLIVGGGPAGLSAALILGRCHRTVLVRDALVERITPAAEGFEFFCTDGTAGTVAKVLLASGLVHELPEVAGIEPLYGISVHHCLYCDGFEYAGKPVAAYGKGDKGADLAVMMKHWMSDVVACSDGTEASAKAIRKLEDHNIPLRSEPIRSLEGADGELTKIVFESGPELPRAGLFIATGCHQARTYPKVLAANVMIKAAWWLTRTPQKAAFPAYMWPVTSLATFFWSR